MRNKKMAIVALMLVMALVVGVGYAALTDTLEISGALGFNRADVLAALDEDIYFTSVGADGATDTSPVIELWHKGADGQPVNVTDTYASQTAVLSASINSNDNDKASFSAKAFKAVGDQVVVTFTIINTGENANMPAALAIATTTGSPGNYFESDIAFSASSDTNANVETDGLPVGETCTVTITLTVTEMPTDENALEGSVTWNITATGVA